MTVSPHETGGAPRRAAALRYRPGKDSAPRLTAQGSGAVAEKIIALAREHGIPVQEDPALIQVLAGLDLNQGIPPSIYLVVAENPGFCLCPEPEGTYPFRSA